MIKIALQVLAVLSVGFFSFHGYASDQKKSDFCEKLLRHTRGFDAYGGDDEGLEREQLGDLARNAGLPYFYMRVPIAKLPEVLSARYLPDLAAEEPQTAPDAVLKFVNSASIGKSIAVELGGLNINLGDDPKVKRLKPMSPDGELIQPNTNLNALVLYSPRVLGLLNWYIGNSVWLGDRARINKSVVPTLCRGWGCVSSGNSRETIAATFEDLGAREGYTLDRVALRIEGMLPSYEIVGVLIQPSNEAYATSVLNQHPNIEAWKKNHIRYSDQFPKIDATKVAYLPEHLRAVVEDINPSIHETDILKTEQAVFSYTPEFGQTVRELFSEGKTGIQIDPIDEEHSFSGKGVSAHNEHFFKEIAEALNSGGTLYGQNIPALLRGAKVSGYDRVMLSSVRKWKFHVLEYAPAKGGSVVGLRKLVVVAMTDEGKKGPPTGAPAIWGIGTLDSNTGKVHWIWKP